MRRLLLSVFASIIFFTPFFSHAEDGVANFGNPGTYLSATPENPIPGVDTIVTLNAYSISLFGARIFWYIDGKLDTAQNDKTSITIPGLKINQTKHISAVIKTTDGDVAVEYVVVPRAAHIIIESDTWVPPWYQGRSLPTANTNLHASVMYFGPKSNGPYTYQWKLGGGSTPQIMKGERVSLKAPLFSGESLSVTIFDADGNTIAESAQTINFKDPEIYFYQRNAGGVPIRSAIHSEYVPITDTVSFTALPYYISGGTNVSYAWSVNGSSVKSEDSDIKVLTLSNLLSSANSVVSLAISYGTHLENTISKSFTIIKP